MSTGSSVTAAAVREPDGELRRAPDLRLVPAALAVWAVLLAGLGLGPMVGGAVVLAGAVVVVAVRRGAGRVGTGRGGTGRGGAGGSGGGGGGPCRP
ncbi:MAG TPA: hypothetical protein VM367_01325, partial [Pseudonocardia sp.]|nr:hypothetical protein [Pseudonocardia sp.]